MSPKKCALHELAELEKLAELLDPDVTWGAPGDPSPSCQSRQQVLSWYRRAKAAGRRAQVLSVTTHGEGILVAVTSTPDEAVTMRWQVLQVAGRRITDIRGFEDEDSAQAAAGPAG